MFSHRSTLITAAVVAVATAQPALTEAAKRSQANITFGSVDMTPIHVDGPAVLADCAATKCTTLNLDHGNLPDYGSIASMTHIDKLMISYTDLQSLAPLLSMTQLTELHIGLTGVSDLSKIGHFKSLKLLHAQSLFLSDISAIGPLTGLEELVIGTAKLTDISALKSLTKLKRLDLSGASAADLSVLEGHSKLETLELMDMPNLTDITPLLSMPQLRTVSISLENLDENGQKTVAQLKANGVNVFDKVEVMIVC